MRPQLVRHHGELTCKKSQKWPLPFLILVEEDHYPSQNGHYTIPHFQTPILGVLKSGTPLSITFLRSNILKAWIWRLPNPSPRVMAPQNVRIMQLWATCCSLPTLMCSDSRHIPKTHGFFQVWNIHHGGIHGFSEPEPHGFRCRQNLEGTPMGNLDILWWALHGPPRCLR